LKVRLAKRIRYQLDLDSDLFAAVLLPSGRLAHSLDCSESENIQHAIGADGNPLVSVHAEGDRV
jgi:hypothetical protein